MNDIVFYVCTALAGACAVLFLIQLTYLFYIYNRIHRKRHKEACAETPSETPPLSVIIVTKDSGEALNRNLPQILKQDYPEFEVIVVNDMSAGEDEDILKRLSEKYTNLYHTFIPQTARYVSRKKLGIAMGIRASRYDWIVMTEPYCHPTSKNWLKSLAHEMTPGTDIVLGYSNYEKGPKKRFSRHIIVTTFFQAVRFLGMALAGAPYMGIGRNMAYRKSLYLSHKGFADHLQLKRGEDDLFVNAVATAQNTRVAVSAESIVRMPTPPFKHIWHEGKMNAIATSRCYKGSARIWNAIETWTCFLFHALSLATVVVSALYAQWIIAGTAALLWLVRMACEMTVLKRTANDLQEHLGVSLFVLDLLRPWWNLADKISYLFSDKSEFFRK